MPKRSLATEMNILKNVKRAVVNMGNMMMFDSLLSTIIAGSVIIGILILIFKFVGVKLFERYENDYQEIKQKKNNRTGCKKYNLPWNL